MSLDDLFVQIYESEKRAKERKGLICEIKNEITRISTKITESKEDAIILKEQLAQKMQLLSEKELQVKLTHHRENVVREQVEKMKIKVKSSHTALQELQERFQESRHDFLEQLADFNSQYDITGLGQERREEEARVKTEELKVQAQEIEKELASLQEKQKEIDDLVNEKKAAEEEIHLYEQKLGKIRDQLLVETTKTRELEKEKQMLSSKPSTDPDYKRYHQELETCKRDSLEGLCQVLQKEVDEVQRKLWQARFQQSKAPQGPPALSLPKRSEQQLGGFQTARTLLGPNQVHPEGPTSTWRAVPVLNTNEYEVADNGPVIDTADHLVPQRFKRNNEYRYGSFSTASESRSKPPALPSVGKTKAVSRGGRNERPQTKVAPQRKKRDTPSEPKPEGPNTTNDTNCTNTWSRFRILPPQPPTPMIVIDDRETDVVPSSNEMGQGDSERKKPNLKKLTKAITNTCQVHVSPAEDAFNEDIDFDDMLLDSNGSMTLEDNFPSLAKKVRFR